FRSLIHFAELNFRLVARDHGKSRWVPEKTQYLKPENIAGMLGRGHDIANDEVRINRFQTGFSTRAALSFGHDAPRIRILRSAPMLINQSVRRARTGVAHRQAWSWWAQRRLNRAH